MTVMAQQQWTLERTGHSPIRFTGEIVADVEKIDQDGIRKYDLRIIRNQKFIAWSVSYDTNWEGEIPYAWAGVVRDEIQLGLALRSFDPIPPRAGFPPGDKYARKQAQFVKTYRALYLFAVEEATKEAGIAVSVPYEGDPNEIIWNNIKSIPDLGQTCVLKFASGEMALAVPQESSRVPGQLSWNIGTTIAYDTPEITAWGYLDSE